MVWHAHAAEDEFFLVCTGTLILRLRHDSQAVLKEGDFHAVRRGVEHLPVAPEECWIMFMEPAQTKHTGEVETEHITEQTAHLGPQVSPSEA